MAVGDVDVAVLEEKIKSHFGKIPAVKNPRPREIVNLENHDETFIAIEIVVLILTLIISN